MENMPPGGALLVCNHSGGMLPMDVPIFATDFYDQLRLRPAPLHAEPRHAHDQGRPETSSGGSATSAPTTRTPTRRCAPAAWSWCSPAATTTCTGRPSSENMIDFGGRTGYVKAALNAGVPIVPDGRHRRPGDADLS